MCLPARALRDQDAAARIAERRRHHQEGGAGALTLHSESAPWQCLNFLPDPHGQGSLRPTLRS